MPGQQVPSRTTRQRNSTYPSEGWALTISHMLERRKADLMLTPSFPSPA
jgi:hypothetical protein